MCFACFLFLFFFFFNDTATTEIYTLSLHDALPIWYTNTARCSPPCPARSPCPSPSMFSRRTMRGPSTARFHTPVCTPRPRQVTSCGSPTLTATSVAVPRLLPPEAYLAGSARTTRLTERVFRRQPVSHSARARP